MNNSFVNDVHSEARAKGWWQQSENGELILRSSGEIRMLIVSEIAEATEEVRKRTPPVYKLQYDDAGNAHHCPPGSSGWAVPSKPEGEAVELADAVIRICDYFGARRWSLDLHLNDSLELPKLGNALEYHMYFVKLAAAAEGESEEKNLGRLVGMIRDYFAHRGWDFEGTLTLKHEFNKSRPYRHGGKAH